MILKLEIKLKNQKQTAYSVVNLTTINLYTNEITCIATIRYTKRTKIQKKKRSE